jgi:hypothetical protein
MMPKSTATTLAGAATNRLPSCRSAWKTVVQGLGQEAARDVVGQGLAVEARLGQGGGVGQRRAVGPGEGQDPLADPVPDHLGRADM